VIHIDIDSGMVEIAKAATLKVGSVVDFHCAHAAGNSHVRATRWRGIYNLGAGFPAFSRILCSYRK
jgi:hypothetical protein